MDAIWQTAQEQWPEIDRDKTGLVFVEMLFVETPVLNEMERIALKPIGDFVMGYGSRADLLAVQRVQ